MTDDDVRRKLSDVYGLPEDDPAIVSASRDVEALRDLHELLKDDKPMAPNPRKQYIMEKTAPIRHDMNRDITTQPRKVIGLAVTAFILGAAVRSIFPLWATAVLGLVLGIFAVSRYVGKFDRERKAAAAVAAAANSPTLKR